MIWPPKWLQTFGPGMRLVSGEIHVLDALSLSQVSINKVCLIIIEGAQSFVHQARIGEIDNKSPQPFYGVFVNRDGTNLAPDYCYKLPKRLNTRLRVWGVEQSKCSIDHLPTQKKHPTMKRELCVNAPLLTCLSPAEQDFLSKI